LCVKYRAIMLLMLFSINLFSQSSSQDINMGIDIAVHQLIQEKTGTIFDRLVQFRRDLHQNPELSGDEKKTAAKIAEFLNKLGLEVYTGIGGHGVIGILKGSLPGPVLAWRADIDACKSDAPDPVDFPSKVTGVRHICGHDLHTSIGLGIAQVLSSLKEKIAGTRIFIFQPAEENLSGAKAMLADSFFLKNKPECCFALHVIPIEAGLATVKTKEVYKRSMEVRLVLQNSENNTKMVQECQSLIKSVNTVENSQGYFDIGVVDYANAGLGTPKSIFADYLAVNNEMEINSNDTCTAINVYIVSSDKENLTKAFSEMKKNLLASAWQKNIRELVITQEYSTVYNDPQATEQARSIFHAIYGDNALLQQYDVIPYNADDFAIFQQKYSGVYFFLGASNAKKGVSSAPHAPFFAVDEEAIKYGVNYFSSLLMEYR